jgi:hypothetical protein
MTDGFCSATLPRGEFSSQFRKIVYSYSEKNVVADFDTTDRADALTDDCPRSASWRAAGDLGSDASAALYICSNRSRMRYSGLRGTDEAALPCPPNAIRIVDPTPTPCSR